MAPHSYSYEIFSWDDKRRLIVETFLCDTKPTDSFYLSFFDSSTLGLKAQTWYDTSGKFIYYTESKNQKVTECFWYHYQPGVKNYDYTIGYRNGELFKEVCIRDKYGANCEKRIITTKKEIKTVILTDERDTSGYCIQKMITVPNKTGKIE
jgi:hypothetical protein